MGIDVMLTAEKYRKTDPDFEDDRESKPDKLLDSNGWIDLVKDLRAIAWPGEVIVTQLSPPSDKSSTAVIHMPRLSAQDTNNRHRQEVILPLPAPIGAC